MMEVIPVTQVARDERTLGQDNRNLGQFGVSALPMDMANPRMLRAEYDSYPPDAFHRDSNAKGQLINDTLDMLAKDGDRLLQLEMRFAAAPRERQAELKHFWTGVQKVTNAAHDELIGLWRQLLVCVCLLVSGEDWLALLSWGLANAKLTSGNPVSEWDFQEFYDLLRKCRKHLLGSSYNRETSKKGHRKVENLPFHDIVHVPRAIMWWGTRFSTAFFEQAHDFILKRYGHGVRVHAIPVDLLPVWWCAIPETCARLPLHRYMKQVSHGTSCLRQVAEAHERTYSQPSRGTKADRRNAHMLDVAAPASASEDDSASEEDSAAEVEGEAEGDGDANDMAAEEEEEAHTTTVWFPEHRSRERVLTASVRGLADALTRWFTDEWDAPAWCPPAVPETVELMNYLELQDTTSGELTTVHASNEFYMHEWHDTVGTISCTWMNRCGIYHLLRAVAWGAFLRLPTAQVPPRLPAEAAARVPGRRQAVWQFNAAGPTSGARHPHAAVHAHGALLALRQTAAHPLPHPSRAAGHHPAGLHGFRHAEVREAPEAPHQGEGMDRPPRGGPAGRAVVPGGHEGPHGLRVPEQGRPGARLLLGL